jgi:hypothetical protein
MSDNILMNALSSRAMPSFIARSILRVFASVHAAASRRKIARGSTEDIRPEIPVYIMEGYHGGMLYWDWLILRKGGRWRSFIWPAVGVPLLARAEKGIPVTLELDAPTFRHMARNQKKAFSRLKSLAASGMIDIVNGTFSQPLLSTISGESAIRQFELGLKAISQTTGFKVLSYACQEPCFCSQLPQILKGFSIPYALIRTHWAPFGKEKGIDSPVISWNGPDGSSVTAVPRYGWMDYANRGDMYPGFMRGNLSGAHCSQWNRKWIEASARDASRTRTVPLLISAMEDLSPHESPIPSSQGLSRMNGIRFITLGSFIKENLTASMENLPAVRLTSDDFRMSLPWGLEADALIIARDSAESALLTAERADAFFSLIKGANRERDINELWEKLLTAQHHDFHLCGPWLSLAHGKPISAYARDLCREVEFSAEGLAEEALIGLVKPSDTDNTGSRSLVLFNPHARKTKNVFLIPGAWEVNDNGTNIPAQIETDGTYIYREIPALGIEVLGLRKAAAKSVAGHEGNCLSFENEFYRASISKGFLSISAGDCSLLSSGCYFSVGMGGHVLDSKKTTGIPGLTACGDILSRWETSGTTTDMPFTQTFMLYRKLPRIDVEVSFQFDDGMSFGPGPSDGRGFYAMNALKLCACFPMTEGMVIRSSPFISEKTDLEIFIGNNWAGIEREGSGLAVICPGARGFYYEKNTGVLKLVLAWSPASWMYASDDSFTPNGSKYVRLNGNYTFHYSLLPYRERIEAVRCAEEIRLPEYCFITGGTASTEARLKSGLFSVEPDEVVLTALLTRRGRLFGRLFNPAGHAIEASLISDMPLEITVCDMDFSSEKPVPDGRINMRPYGIQTIGICDGS